MLFNSALLIDIWPPSTTCFIKQITYFHRLVSFALVHACFGRCSDSNESIQTIRHRLNFEDIRPCWMLILPSVQLHLIVELSSCKRTTEQCKLITFSLNFKSMFFDSEIQIHVKISIIFAYFVVNDVEAKNVDKKVIVVIVNTPNKHGVSTLCSAYSNLSLKYE